MTEILVAILAFFLGRSTKPKPKHNEDFANMLQTRAARLELLSGRISETLGAGDIAAMIRTMGEFIETTGETMADVVGYVAKE